MTLSFPTLDCPFPAAINPHVETTERATAAWALRHGLIQTTDVERSIHEQWTPLMARCYPHASLAGLQWLSDWMTWVFVIDDQNDEGEQGRLPEQLDQLQTGWLAMLRGGRLTQDDPRGRAWYDLVTRLRAQAAPAWLKRFIQHYAAYFVGCIWEATNRAQRRVPDPEAYLLMRTDSSLMYPCLALIEFVDQLTLPAAVHVHPLVQALTLIANNVGCWSNDILSIEKELEHGDVHNLVIVLRHAHQCSLPEAMERAAVMHNAEVRRFQILATQLPSFTPAIDADLRRYILGLEYWMRANLDWSLDSGRYGSIALNS